MGALSVASRALCNDTVFVGVWQKVSRWPAPPAAQDIFYSRIEGTLKMAPMLCCPAPYLTAAAGPVRESASFAPSFAPV
jgi:hypothetical protein